MPTSAYGAEISPLAVATIQRLPQRTMMESMRPMPGTTSPRAAIRIPSGPSSTAVPPRTSRTAQPAMVVGLVSGPTGAAPQAGSSPSQTRPRRRAKEAGFEASADCAPLDGLTRGFGATLAMTVEGCPKAGAVREPDAFRTLSVLPPALVSGMRREAAST